MKIPFRRGTSQIRMARERVYQRLVIRNSVELGDRRVTDRVGIIVSRYGRLSKQCLRKEAELSRRRDRGTRVGIKERKGWG